MMQNVTPPPRSVDELLFHMPAAGRYAGSKWAQDFARSIMVQASQRRRWQPTGKQLGIMRRMVSEMFQRRADDADFTVVE